MTLGERILQKRKEAGDSQESLGAKLGVSRQTVYKWENDQAVPELSNLTAMAKIFGCKTGWLIAGEDEESTNAAYEEAVQRIAEIVEKRQQEKGTEEKTKGKKRPRLLYGALAVLCAALVFMGVRIRNMEDHYDELRSSIEWLRGDVQQSISRISYDLQNTLDQYNNAVLESSVSIAGTDYKENTVTFDVRLVPKITTEDMRVTLDAVFVKEDGEQSFIQAEAKRMEDGSFQTLITCPLTDNLSIRCTLQRQDEKETVLLSKYTNLYSQSFDWYDIVWPFSFSLDKGKMKFEDLYCEVAVYEDRIPEGMTKAKTASVRVFLYDQDEQMVCEYQKTSRPSSVSGTPNEWMYFERPAELRLDPQKEYYEILQVMDEYGRIKETEYKYKR